ncbi:MAG: hypothetical protein LBL58_14850 [Tannerellaceae bacterium]|nr:hypothetical protein [Tannerellaceae bacterium]
MKRLLFVLFIAVAFVSCEGPMGPQGPDGEPGGTWEEMKFIVHANEWTKIVEKGTPTFYYSYEGTWNALDELAVERGIVIPYMLDFTGAYTTLPYVFHDKDSNTEWTETTSFSFFKGGFEVQVTNSDFADVSPGEKSFRIIIFK